MIVSGLKTLLATFAQACGVDRRAEFTLAERRTSQRQAAQAPRINFHRLDSTALRRYRRFYQLQDVGPNSTKVGRCHLLLVTTHGCQRIATCTGLCCASLPDTPLKCACRSSWSALWAATSASRRVLST